MTFYIPSFTITATTLFTLLTTSIILTFYNCHCHIPPALFTPSTTPYILLPIITATVFFTPNNFLHTLLYDYCHHSLYTPYYFHNTHLLQLPLPHPTCTLYTIDYTLHTPP